MTLAAVAIFLFCVDDSVMLILGSIPREARIHGTLVTVAVHLGIGGLSYSSVGFVLPNELLHYIARYL